MCASFWAAVAVTHGRRTASRRRLVACTAVLLVTFLGAASTATAATTASIADPTVISDWNALAIGTFSADPKKVPQETPLYMGFVQAAVYDAVVGIDRRYEPYRFDARAPRGTSAQAAAVAAAHKVLVTYSPYAKANLDAAYATSLAQIPDGKAKTRGIAFGTLAADNLITMRANDGRNAPVLFTQPPAPGVWRPTPPAFLPMAVPWMGSVTPLLLRSGAQFGEPGPPPALTSSRYTRDFAEVKALGSATSTLRTPEQTSTALFFSGNAAVAVQRGTPGSDDGAAPGHRGRRQDVRGGRHERSRRDHLRLAREIPLRLLAAHHRDPPGRHRRQPRDDRRPNLDAASDDAYLSRLCKRLLRSHRSLYPGLADALDTSHLQLTLTSTSVPGAVRHYDSGSSLRNDVVDARVWLGIHFRSADTGGVDMGQRVADWALDHYFGEQGHRHHR